MSTRQRARRCCSSSEPSGKPALCRLRPSVDLGTVSRCRSHLAVRARTGDTGPWRAASHSIPAAYFPLGSLRAALTYPVGEGRVTPRDMSAALACVELEHLAPRMDEIAARSEVLSQGQPARLWVTNSTLRLRGGLVPHGFSRFQRRIVPELPTALLPHDPVIAFAGQNMDGALHKVNSRWISTSPVKSLGQVPPIIPGSRPPAGSTSVCKARTSQSRRVPY